MSRNYRQMKTASRPERYRNPPIPAVRVQRKLESKNFAQRFHRNIFLVCEIVVILAALIGLYLTIEEIKENSKARKAEAIARAWSILTAPVPGNSSKGHALEYLASQGIRLDRIDVSCSVMNGTDIGKNCFRPVYLANLDLSKSKGVSLANAKFRHADLSEADLSGANLNGADLLSAKLRRAKLNDAYLVSAYLLSAYLLSAYLLRANLNGANFRYANLSGADFKKSVIDNRTNFSDAWAWRDRKPIGLDADIIFCVFDPEIHRRDIETRPDSCARPE